jgi:hypothetical protein
VTGASGGMLGAAYYTAALPEVVKARGATPRQPGDTAALTEQFRALATGDFLTPLVEETVFRDLPCFFSPWPRHSDRGQALEQAWLSRLPVKLDLDFKALRALEEQAKCPSLVFSPMMIEDGRRLLISNLDLRYVASNDGNLLDGAAASNRPGNYSHEALELFRLFPDAPARFRLSTAVRLSASFPYFSPASHLPTLPRRRVVDAGYYDNYGTNLACSWLTSRMHRDWIDKNASKVVVIQIRDGYTQEDRRLDAMAADPSSLLSRALEQLTSPPEGLWQMRISTNAFRNDGQLELLSQLFNEERFVRDLEMAVQESAKAAPAELSKRAVAGRVDVRQAQAAMDQTLGSLEKKLRQRYAGTGPAPVGTKEMTVALDRMKRDATEGLRRQARGGEVEVGAATEAVQQPLRRMSAELKASLEAQAGRSLALAQRHRFLTVVDLEFKSGGEVSLSWMLTPKEQRLIQQDAGWPPGGQGDALGAAIQELLRWWKE